jgi:SpoVK/Ycf46/Vps4 family AAA+-type ATPase
MCADFTRFFASRDLYEQYGVPWKRGVILTGPPGNGKTHAVKALVNKIGHACLYVKSFSSQYGSEHSNIHQVFRRARSTTPCVLVLEDLDSLVTDTNRSFFLNELDGFAANTGVVVVATTNHPERLDPAIVNRPSRFDRKYHFGLPGPDERRAYLALWRDSLRPELQPTDAGIADATDDTSGFSFAYLKELTVSSIMRWIDAPEPRAMDAVLGAQIAMLREQMSSMDALYDAPSSVPTGEDEEDA